MTALLEFLGRLHLVILHLPIGMIAGLAIYEWHATRRKLNNAPKIWVNSTAIVTILAVASGLILHERPGYIENETMELHERFGLLTALSSICCAIFYLKPKVYKTFLTISVIGVLITGHFGGSMTHGEGFLTEPFLNKDEKITASTEKKIAQNFYSSKIAPILEAKCNKCHNDKKQKGSLRLDSPVHILTGGKSEGPAIILEALSGHPLLERIMLGMEDEDHMPPEGKPQLTEEEIALIKRWCKNGAPMP